MKRVAINSLIFHSGGCTSGRDSRRPACARDNRRRESGRDDKQDSEGETEKEGEEDRGGEKEGERGGRGEGHFKHCPLVRKLNFESRTGH